ncbi:MAG: TorF family putative porin [Pseudomonadota bacterium]
MRISKYISSVTGAAVLFTSVAASAVEMSGSATIATDYIFRGVSQTSEKGAVQAGIDVAWDSGVYAGIWGSNVDFGSEVTTEMDFFVGYGFDVAEGVSLDLSYIYFNYAGNESALNYSEYVASLGVSDFSFTLVYSPDYFGSDESTLVYAVGYSTSLSDNWSIDLHVGYTDSDTDALGTDEDSYLDYLAGVNYDWGGTTFTLAVTGTDADEDENFGDLGETRAVFSISRSM